MAAARKAFDHGEWPRMSGKQRGKVRGQGRRLSVFPTLWSACTDARARFAPAHLLFPSCPPFVPPSPLTSDPSLPPSPRATPSQVMMRIADLIEKHADELAGIESLDNGKPLVMSKIADIPLSADHFRYYGGWADKLHGKVRRC